MSRLFTALLFLALIPTARGQSLFSATLLGSAEVPPVSTEACGWALVTLNPDDSLSYELNVTGISGAGATAAHIHSGAAGVNGGVLVPLSGGPQTWSGSSAPLSAGELSALRSEGLYINVHSAAHTGGEIRGQLVNAVGTFGARLRAGQVEPPVDSLAHGFLDLTLNPDRSLDYSLSVFNMEPDGASLRVGEEGSNGAALFSLTASGATTFAGTTPVLGADELATLQDGGLYVTVTSESNPLGQCRGQVLPSALPLMPGCSELTLEVSGSPSTYGRLEVSVSGGAPGSMGLLIGTLDDGLTQMTGEPFLIDVPSLVSAVTPVFLDGSGSGQVTAKIADISSSFTTSWQFFDVTPTAPNGLWQGSNGIRLPVRHLPEGEPISFEDDVYPLFGDPAYGCTGCHSSGSGFSVPWVVQPTAGSTWSQLQGRIEKDDPAASLLLTWPLDPGAGGSGNLHTGGSLFPDTDDAMYEALLTWIASGAPNN